MSDCKRVYEMILCVCVCVFEDMRGGGIGKVERRLSTV